MLRFLEDTISDLKYHGFGLKNFFFYLSQPHFPGVLMIRGEYDLVITTNSI